jgi:superfamily II DNA or RNA helicase
MMMRTYETVGRTLPPLEEHTIIFDMPAPLHKAYRELKKDWLILGAPVESVGSVYYMLRQLTMCQEKVSTVKEIVESIPRDEGVLVYTQYLESAHTLANTLKRGYKEEVPVTLITGETPPQKRAMMLAEQKRTRHPRIVVATIGALQEGQNMEHIRHVVYAEETYVKGEHRQTLARTRRDRGDEHQHAQPPVIVYYVRARKTIDQQIPVIRESRGKAGDHELARTLAREAD